MVGNGSCNISPVILSLSFDSGPSCARNAMARVRLVLDDLSLSLEQLSSVDIVLAEVLNNIVEHAYSLQPGQPISLRLRREHHEIRFEITDRGRAMPQNRLPQGIAPDPGVKTADMPEGGFGWFLIRHLVSQIEYLRVGAENRLNFRLSVGDSTESD